MSEQKPTYYTSNTHNAPVDLVPERLPTADEIALALIDLRLRVLKQEIALLEKLRREVAP